MNSVQKTYGLLSRSERIVLWRLLVANLAVAVIDVFGIASIMPFIALLANPEVIRDMEPLTTLYSMLQAQSVNSFQILVGAFSLGLLIVSGALRGMTNFLNLRFLMFCEAGISSRLFEGYIRQPYTWFLTRHSANLNKLVHTEISKVISEILGPSMTLITQGIFSLLLIGLLVWIDPIVTLVAAVVFGFFYIVISVLSKRLTLTHGRDRFRANETRHRVFSDALGGIRELKAFNIEGAFIGQYAVASRTYARSHSLTSLIHSVPRYILEIVSMGGLLSYLIFGLIKGVSLENSLPIVSIFALAGYRLLPVMQNIFVSVTLIRFATAGIDAIYRDYVSCVQNVEPSQESVAPPEHWDLLSFKNVEFTYPGFGTPAIKDVSLDIRRGEYIGLMGPSGSGKSTLVNIVLGLLEADEGKLEIDGVQVMNRVHKTWCGRQVGYVPQQIFLTDDSVASNIALGLSDDQIDLDRVRWAARIAQIDGVIEGELSRGYSTLLGERGERLSGGQRQRIGIARALYRRPSLIVLDEATAALDSKTEANFFMNLRNSLPDLAVIIISHDLNIYNSCDVLYSLHDGQVKAHGAPEKL